IWIPQKNTAERELKKTDMQQRIRDEQERKQREWLRANSLQHMRENELKNFQEAERSYFTEKRSKEQCEKAYKDWLQKKARERRKHAKGSQEMSHFVRTIRHRVYSERTLSKVVPVARDNDTQKIDND
ncbi:hypothetical protein CLF_100005, partial [Clonorchis sinensis]